jgi:hypothetical protein
MTESAERGKRESAESKLSWPHLSSMTRLPNAAIHKITPNKSRKSRSGLLNNRFKSERIVNWPKSGRGWKMS